MKKTILIIIAVAAVCMGISFLLFNHMQKKIAVVDVIKLVNEFQMKKDLETNGTQQVKQVGIATDSLKRLLQASSNDARMSKEELQNLYSNYMSAQRQYDTQVEQLSQEINEQVWNRLNPLIDEYGKQENLRLVIGANGMGTVLYNDDYYDHTQQLIKYVNAKYAKGL